MTKASKAGCRSAGGLRRKLGEDFLAHLDRSWELHGREISARVSAPCDWTPSRGWRVHRPVRRQEDQPACRPPAKQKHATAELEQRAGSRHREVRRQRGGQDTPRSPDQQDQNPRRCQKMRRPYTSTHNPPDGATWQKSGPQRLGWASRGETSTARTRAGDGRRRLTDGNAWGDKQVGFPLPGARQARLQAQRSRPLSKPHG